METTVKNVITPNDQFIRDVFSRTKAYHIDIYQREYKWSKEEVDALLSDIELRFRLHQRTKTAPKEIQADVLQNFEPYYLNTFLTNAEPTAIVVVDGQQRLTTFLIILIKLRKLLLQIESLPELRGKTFSSQAIESLIFERDDFGSATRFKIFNENREVAFKAIVDSHLNYEPKDETQKNIIENFKHISNYFDAFFLSDVADLPCDYNKLTYYICYILDRLSIVEIKIEQQKNVAMIFEVVNDRGLGLQPHEILKGKFIGSLPKQQKEEANIIWTKLAESFYASSIEFDDFLQTYFRSKFTNQTTYDKFSNDRYHYEVQRNPKTLNQLSHFRDGNVLYRFVKDELQYFGELYHELKKSLNYEHVFYNRLNNQHQQLLLILSAIRANDSLRNEKIKLVSKKFDQVYVALTLLDAFDSRDIQRYFQELNETIRHQEMESIASAFDSMLIRVLTDKEVIQEGSRNSLPDIFKFELFKGMANNRHDFSKYVLMRIDRHISEKLDLPGYMKCSLEELEERFQTKRKYGLHLEHILAHNEDNHRQFIDPETQELDEERFNRIRNLLGMVLLLKDRQNESSNNEHFGHKFNRYTTSNFIWNQLMVGHLDVVDSRNIPESWNIRIVKPTTENCFPEDEIIPRQKAVFSLINEIWNF